jgi:hypothetical protein
MSSQISDRMGAAARAESGSGASAADVYCARRVHTSASRISVAPEAAMS